jgi:SNF2 family DNA or RNA helicase
MGQCKHKFEATYDWPFLFGQEWDAIVLDESHNLLASTANYQSKRITQARYGAVMIRRKLKPDGLAVALSGTPFRSNLTKGWGTLNWLRPDVFSSYWQWAGTHFGVEQGRYGQIVGGGAKVPRPLDEGAWDAMLRPYYLKRTKAEVAADLPPIQYAGTPIDGDGSPCYVQIEMEPKQAKAYHQMVADAEAEIEGGKILATGVLAEITRQRQFANAYGHLDSRREVSPTLPSNKLDWIIEFMQEREGTGLKVVIASSFTEMVELTAEVLRKEGFEVLTLTGATSDKKRADLVARFQDPNDSLQVVVINRKAGGESITLDAADDMIVIDPPWISDDDEQLYARIHRVSRVHQVTIYRLISTGTIDGWIAGLTDDQRAVLATADPRKLSELIREATA